MKIKSRKLSIQKTIKKKNKINEVMLSKVTVCKRAWTKTDQVYYLLIFSRRPETKTNYKT